MTLLLSHYPCGRTKIAGIVNKVSLLPVLSRVSGVEVVGCEDGRRSFLQKPDKKNYSPGVCWDPGYPVVRKARNCNASGKYRLLRPNLNVVRISRKSKIIEMVFDLDVEFNGAEINSKSLSILQASSRNSLLSNIVDDNVIAKLDENSVRDIQYMVCKQQKRQVNRVLTYRYSQQ